MSYIPIETPNQHHQTTSKTLAHCEPPPSQPLESSPTIPCHMFGPSQWTQADFPPLEFKQPEENTRHAYKIPTPTTKQPSNSNLMVQPSPSQLLKQL